MQYHNCPHAKACPGYGACLCGTPNCLHGKSTEKEVSMNSNDIVMALAMNRDPATVIVGNTKIPVMITDVDSTVAPGRDETKFTCQVVNVPSRPTFADRFTPAERAYIAANVASVDQAIIRNHAPAGMRGGFTLPLGGMFAIDRVYFNDPVTVVLWKDGTKTIVRCQEGDTYSAETGLALCFAKKALGNKGSFNDVFKKFVPEEKVEETPVEETEVLYEEVDENA